MEGELTFVGESIMYTLYHILSINLNVRRKRLETANIVTAGPVKTAPILFLTRPGNKVYK